MSRCRFAHYESGFVTRNAADIRPDQNPAGQPNAPAKIRKGPDGIIIVEADMVGATWYGRLVPKRDGLIKGSVLLFEKPKTKGE